MGLVHGFIVEVVDGNGEVMGRIEGRGVNVSFGEDLTAREIWGNAGSEGGDRLGGSGEGKEGDDKGENG